MNPDVQASAYVDKGKLYIVGLCPSTVGMVPFTYYRKVEGDPPEGPVIFGQEIHPAIEKALDQSQGPIMHQVDLEKIKRATTDLIIRARQGDQNAIAMLVGVRESAKQGSERAKVAYDIALKCAESKNSNAPSFAGSLTEPSNALVKAIDSAKSPLQLAATFAVHVPASGPSLVSSALAASTIANHAPRISAQLLSAVRNTLSTAMEKLVFTHAIKKSNNPKLLMAAAKKAPAPIKNAIQMGYTLGSARAIQDVRVDGPIAALSPMAAWELGEGPEVVSFQN